MITQLKTCHKTLLLFFLLLTVVSAKAQRADSATYLPNKTYYWAGFHLGGGTYMANIGADAGILLHNNLVIATKIEANGSLDIFHTPEHVEADEYAMLAGWKLTHRRYSNLILLSGISAVRIEDRGDPIGYQNGLFAGTIYGDHKIYTGVGIPVIMKFTVSPASPVALDFAAAANINGKRTFFALTFGVSLGKLRSGVRATPPSGAGPEPPRRERFKRN